MDSEVQSLALANVPWTTTHGAFFNAAHAQLTGYVYFIGQRYSSRWGNCVERRLGLLYCDSRGMNHKARCRGDIPYFSATAA